MSEQTRGDLSQRQTASEQDPDGRADWTATRILILETREEAQVSRLLDRAGRPTCCNARCSPSTTPRTPAPVAAWIRPLSSQRPCDDLVLTTGEGLRRLVKAARRRPSWRSQDSVAALRQAAPSSRAAPNPALGAARDRAAGRTSPTEEPTSEGIAAMLARLRSGRPSASGLQLYPDEDHSVLIAAIAAQRRRRRPRCCPTSTTRSAAESQRRHRDRRDGARAAGRRAGADQFGTAAPAVRRRARASLRREAARRARYDADCVGRPRRLRGASFYGLRADITPDNGAYFMKPLISAMATALAQRAPR